MKHLLLHTVLTSIKKSCWYVYLPQIKVLMSSTVPPHMKEMSIAALNILPFFGFD